MRAQRARPQGPSAGSARRRTRLLDIACGFGHAASVAAGRGATVAGLDASEALIAIAQARTPDADFRVGDMFELPFEDDRFDVATSFNGIWKGCEDTLREARRVVRPGGLVGFSFWGSPKRLGLLPYFATLLELSPTDHVDATLNQGGTGRPGVAEQMLADAGLEFVDRGAAQVINEWPDLDLAARARGDTPHVHPGSRCPDHLRVRLDHGAGAWRLIPRRRPYASYSCDGSAPYESCHRHHLYGGVCG
jgi:SAM-dependent methyltransferase